MSETPPHYDPHQVPEPCNDYAPDTLNPVEEDRGICTTCFRQGEDHPVSKEELAKRLKGMLKSVAEQTRAEEARFIVEHDGSSSAEFYGEGGTNDAQDEKFEVEDEDWYGEGHMFPEVRDHQAEAEDG